MTGGAAIAPVSGTLTRMCAAAIAALALGLLLACAPATAAPGATGTTALQVSFDAGAKMRLRGQSFTGTGAGAANAVLARHPGVRVARMFDASEADLDARRARLLRAGRRDVPDLNRHYRIVAVDAAQRDGVVRELAALAVVDDARAEPQPAPPPATGNWVSLQRYGAAAPAGIGAAALASLPGGRGEQTKIVDVEYSWNRAHEDLAKAAAPTALIENGEPADPFGNTNHGTAVLGTLIGTDNGFGITGLSPNSQIGLVNAYQNEPCYCWALAQAISRATDDMAPGDVMLVEQQVRRNAGDVDFVAAEYTLAVYDAILTATQSGIIVVEAAGNGQFNGVNLDSPEPFPQGRPDSGAIIVGAGTGDGAGSGDCAGTANARTVTSAYGDRVNLQGWGQCVTTTGIGDLFDGGANALYTATFNGTSSASAIVAGAAALYSSVHQAVKGSPPSPQLVRARLVATGTPQAAGSTGHIGPLPNLAAAADDFQTLPPPPPPPPAPPPSEPLPPPQIGFTGSGDTVVAPPAPAPAQAPAIGPASALTVRVAATGAVRLSRPRIGCPATGPACRVSVTVRRSGAVKTTLGRAALTVQPGRTATIRFTLTRAARTLLKRKGRLKATAKVTARQAGLTSTRTLRLTLKRR